MNSPVMQGLNLNAPAYVKNAKLIAWVADMAALCKPDSIYWCDGSEAEHESATGRGTAGNSAKGGSVTNLGAGHGKGDPRRWRPPPSEGSERRDCGGVERSVRRRRTSGRSGASRRRRRTRPRAGAAR